MEMIFYKTRNTLLQKYMEGYYFISDDQSSDIIRYRTFPNNYTILSVSHKAEVLFEDNRITVKPSHVTDISVDVVFRYNNPIEVYYENAVDEITFYFKPLGLNNFIESDNFSKYKSLMNFHVFSDFNLKMLEIFKLKDREKQIEEIEAYWLSKLNIKDFTLMEKLLIEIETGDLKIDEIADRFNFSRQYINKLFLKHIGKSPAEYRKIHRFRSSLKKKAVTKKLTALSHENLFYDQSHFNKYFKELTNYNPSAFFKNVDIEKENVWLFI